MKQAEINELSTKDLNEKLKIESDRLVKLKLNHSVSPIENPLTITAQRKTVARLNTEITKRNKAEAVKAEAPKAEAPKEKAAKAPKAEKKKK
jgi:large subunit ribosomal protein L29